MRDGTVHVRNLQLNCAHINTLPSLTPLGLSFEEGLVGCVSLQLPGLLNRSAADDGDATPVPAGTRVHLEELLLCVRVLERESGPHTAAAAAAASGDACNTAAPAEATPFTAGVRHALSTWLSEAEGKAPVRGAQMLATWIDALLKVRAPLPSFLSPCSPVFYIYTRYLNLLPRAHLYTHLRRMRFPFPPTSPPQHLFFHSIYRAWTFHSPPLASA